MAACRSDLLTNPVNDHRDAKAPIRGGGLFACSSKPIRLVSHLRSPGTYVSEGRAR